MAQHRQQAAGFKEESSPDSVSFYFAFVLELKILGVSTKHGNTPHLRVLQPPYPSFLFCPFFSSFFSLSFCIRVCFVASLNVGSAELHRLSMLVCCLCKRQLL